MEVFSFHSRKTFWGSMVLCILLVSFLSACDAGNGASTAQGTPGCTALGASASAKGASAAVAATVPLPGQPVQALATADGKWIFVSLNSKSAASNGIAVLQQQGTQVCLKRVIPLNGTPLGLTLTHKEDLLLVADYSSVAVIDAKQAEQQVQGAVLGYIHEQSTSSTVEVVLSPDEHYAFATNQNDGTLSVINFQRVRVDDFNPDVMLGQISLGAGPLGLAMSLDNRYLFATVGGRSDTATGQGTCTTQGALVELDIQRVEQDSAHAIVASAPAGCDPARVYLSSDDSTAWVTSRGDNKVLAFNTLTLLSDPTNALVGSIQVGPAPVGLGIAQTGSMLFVANSNSFNQPQKPQTLSVLNVHNLIQGLPAVIATIKVGAFPREVTIENDDQTVLLTNSNSNSLTIINAAKLPKPKH